MVLGHDQKFAITQPDFKRVKLDDNKGILHEPIFANGMKLTLFADD